MINNKYNYNNRNKTDTIKRKLRDTQQSLLVYRYFSPVTGFMRVPKMELGDVPPLHLNSFGSLQRVHSSLCPLASSLRMLFLSQYTCSCQKWVWGNSL